MCARHPWAPGACRRGGAPRHMLTAAPASSSLDPPLGVGHTHIRWCPHLPLDSVREAGLSLWGRIFERSPSPAPCPSVSGVVPLPLTQAPELDWGRRACQMLCWKPSAQHVCSDAGTKITSYHNICHNIFRAEVAHQLGQNLLKKKWLIKEVLCVCVCDVCKYVYMCSVCGCMYVDVWRVRVNSQIQNTLTLTRGRADVTASQSVLETPPQSLGRDLWRGSFLPPLPTPESPTWGLET